MQTINEPVSQLWPDRDDASARIAPDVRTGKALHGAIHRLIPRDDSQYQLKNLIVATALEIGLLRELLVAHATPSISQPLLVVVVSWLVTIFLGFSVVSPINLTTSLALLVTTLAVTAAIFRILELDQPFTGLFKISGVHFFSILTNLAH